MEITDVIETMIDDAIKIMIDRRLFEIHNELQRLEAEWRFNDATYERAILDHSNYDKFRDAARPLEREHEKLIQIAYSKKELQKKICGKCGLWHTKELIHSHRNL